MTIVRRNVLLCLLVLVCIFFAFIVYRKHSVSPPTQNVRGVEREPPSTLAVGAETRWQPAYAGDPLMVSVRVWSPSERQELYEQTVKAEQGKPASPSSLVPLKIAHDWASSVSLGLFRIDQAGGRVPVVPPGAWESYRIKADAGLSSLAAVGLASPSAAWIVSPDAARLTAGQYVLTVAWKGGAVTAESGAAGGVIKGREVFFDVRSAIRDPERADHLGRLAYFEYTTGSYERARTDARQAVMLDRENLLPERTEAWFVLAKSSIALRDFKAAREALADLLSKLPPPEASDVAALAKEMLDAVIEYEKVR